MIGRTPGINRFYWHMVDSNSSNWYDEFESSPLISGHSPSYSKIYLNLLLNLLSDDPSIFQVYKYIFQQHNHMTSTSNSVQIIVSDV